MKRMGRVGAVVAVAALLVVALLGLVVLSPVPAAAQNTACYRAQGGALWACGSGGTMQFASGSTLDVQSGATVYFTPTVQFAAGAAIIGNTSIGDGSNASTLAVWGNQSNNANFILQGWQRMDGETFTVLDGLNITPTNTYMELTSSGTVTAAGIVAGTEGDLLILVNVGAQSIILPDSGTLKLSGELTLGASDSVTLIADGTNWVQLATSNN